MGHPNDAISDLNKAIHVAPNYASSYYIRGKLKVTSDIAVVEGEPDGVQDLQTALELAEKAGNEKLKESIMKLL